MIDHTYKPIESMHALIKLITTFVVINTTNIAQASQSYEANKKQPNKTLVTANKKASNLGSIKK